MVSLRYQREQSVAQVEETNAQHRNEQHNLPFDKRRHVFVSETRAVVGFSQTLEFGCNQNRYYDIQPDRHVRDRDK